MALEIKIDTNAANAAVAELRKNLSALGGDTKLSAAEIQKLEEQMRKKMGADAAAEALAKLQRQTGMTEAEMKKLREQLGDTAKPKGFADAVGGLTGNFEKLAKAILGITAGLAALSMLKDAFAEAKAEYAKFQSAVIDIQKVTPNSFKKITETLQEIPPTLASASDAARAYYQALSAGFPGIEVTTAALKASNAAHTDAATSMNAITKVMNVYKMSSEEASKATSMLYGIEAAGVTTFGQLAPVIGDVATKAKQAGIDMEAMGGIMATVVKTTGSTNIAATSVGALFIDLGKQWKDLDGNLKGVFKNLSDQTGKVINNFEDFKNTMSGVDEKTGKPMDKTIQALKTLDTEAQKSGKRLDSMFSDQTAKLAAQKIQKSFEDTAAAVEQVGSAVDKNLSDKAYDNWAKSIEGKAELVKNAQSQVNKIIGEEFTRAISESTSAVTINGVAVGSWSAITNKAWMLLAEHPEVIRNVMKAMQDLSYVVILAGAPAMWSGISTAASAALGSITPVITAVTNSFTTGMFSMGASAMSTAQLVGAAGILVGTFLAAWKIGSHIREWIESFDAGKLGLQSFADTSIGAFIILKGALIATWTEITVALTSGMNSAMMNVSAIINAIIAKAQSAIGTVLDAAAGATSFIPGMKEQTASITALSDKFKGLSQASAAAAEADKASAAVAAAAGKEKIAAVTSAAKAEYEAHTAQAAQNQAAIKTEFELRDRKKEIVKETADFKKQYGFEAAEADKDIAEQEAAIAEDAADQIGQINQRQLEKDEKYALLSLNFKKGKYIEDVKAQMDAYEKSDEFAKLKEGKSGEFAQKALDTKMNALIMAARAEDAADKKSASRGAAASAREEKLIEKQMAKREDLENKWQGDIANIREDEGDKFEKMLNREIEVAKRAGADLVMLEDWIAAQREQRRKASEEKIAEDIKNIRESESSKFTQGIAGSSANPKGDNVAAYEKAGVSKVKIDEWVSAQIFKNQEDLSKKLESEYESINGTKLDKQLLAIDKEYKETVKAQDAILELLRNRGLQETAEYQKVLNNKQRANEIQLAKKAQVEQEALKKTLDFEIEYQKSVNPYNQDGINALESQKRALDMKEKYKDRDPAKVQEMILAEEAKNIEEQQQKLTESIRKTWDEMSKGMAVDAQGNFAISAQNMGKMAGNLLDMAKGQGKGDAAAGFSALFSGKVKEGDPLGGIASIGKSIAGSSIGKAVLESDIGKGVSGFFSSASEGILSGVPWGSIASGALSLLSGGFSAKNIASTVASTAAAIFLPGVGALLAPVIGKLVGSLFGNEAGWGVGIDAKSVKWGQKAGSFGTHELDRSSGTGDEQSAGLVSEFQKQTDAMLTPIYDTVGNFLEKLPQGAQDKANEILKDAEIAWGDVINWSQDGDQQTRTALNLSYIQTEAIRTASVAVNAANAEFAAGYDRSLIQTGSKLDTMLNSIGGGFKFQEAGADLSEKDKIAFREAETKRFQEYLNQNEQFNAAMTAGSQLITGINAQLKPMTEYDQGMKSLKDELKAADDQLVKIGYSEKSLADVRAKSAELIAKVEAEYAKKRADVMADVRESYELDGLTEYQKKMKEIDDDFVEREESLKQLGATEKELTELSNIKIQVLQKEAEAYRQSREAIFAELDILAGFKPDFGEFEAGFEDLNSKLIGYRDSLIAAGATPEMVQAATEKYAPVIQQKFQGNILNKSAELGGRKTEQTDYAAGAAKINTEFADMWKALEKSGGSTAQFITLQKDYYSAMQLNAKAQQTVIDGVKKEATEMAFGKKSVDLFTAATMAVNEKFKVFSQTVAKAGGDITALDKLRGDAITQAIKDSMFGDITAQSVAGLLSEGVKKGIENSKAGLSTDWTAMGKNIQTSVQDSIRSSVANVLIGQTADMIQTHLIDPLLTSIAEKAKDGSMSNQDIVDAMYAGADPMIARTAEYQIQQEMILNNATAKAGETIEAAKQRTLTELGKLDDTYKDVVEWKSSVSEKPIDIDAPEYDMPEYDNKVDILPPIYDMPEYNNRIRIAPPTFETATNRNTTAGARVGSYAGGLVGVPENEMLAYIHKDEIVITAQDAPDVWGYMQRTGIASKYPVGKIPASNGEIPKLNTGSRGNLAFDSTVSGSSFDIGSFFSRWSSQITEGQNQQWANTQAETQQVTNAAALAQAFSELGVSVTDTTNRIVQDRAEKIKQGWYDEKSINISKKIMDNLKSDKSLSGDFQSVNNLLSGISDKPDAKSAMATDIDKAKVDAVALLSNIAPAFREKLNKEYAEIYYTEEQRGKYFSIEMENLSKSVTDAMIKQVKDKYDAERNLAEQNLAAYIAGLAGEKIVIDEVAKAHEDADKQVKDFAQKIVDAGGTVDVAAKKVEAYAQIEKRFIQERDDIYLSASNRIAELKGESTLSVDKEVAAERKRFEEYITNATSKGAKDEELATLRTQEEEAVRLVTAATEKKIEADKANSESEKAKSNLLSKSSGLQDKIADFQLGLSGVNKYEEKLKSFAGKEVKTEDDLNTFVDAQIGFYQDKFDTLADTYGGWEDVKKTATGAVKAFDLIDDSAKSISDIPARADDSLLSVQDYVASMTEWAENAKKLREDFTSLKSGIDESRNKIKDDLSVSGMSKMDALDSKIKTGMGSLQSLSPEEGLKKAQELRDLVMERYDEEKSQVESVKDSIDKMKDAAESLRKKSDDLKYSDFNLAKGNVKQDMLAQDYQSLLAKAKTGDTGAINEYTGFIDKYLQSSKDMYASSDTYKNIYAQVQADLGGLGASAGAQVPAQEAYLASLNTVASQTNNLLDQLAGYADSQIVSIDTGLLENKSVMETLLSADGAIATQTAKVVTQVSALDTTIKTGNDSLIAALTAILNKEGTIEIKLDSDTLVSVVVNKINKANANGQETFQR